MSEDNLDRPNPNNTRIDHVVVALRGSLGLVPVVGSLVAEVVTSLIPNQRLDRIANYLRFLESEIDKLKIGDLPNRLKAPENIDLIEDGAIQAVRSLNDGRTITIARFVAHGIAVNGDDKRREKKLLWLLSQMDDDDLLILDAMAAHSGDKMDRLRPKPAVIGCEDGILFDNLLYEATFEKLTRLGLFVFRVHISSDLGIPEFDRFSGKPTGYHVVSPLGRAVLDRCEFDRSAP